jgi:hypothetical protein
MNNQTSISPAITSPSATRVLNGLRALHAPLILLFAAICAWNPLVGGFDFWAHAAVGSWIWTHAQPPHAGLFIWSEPSTPWVAHSWLSQLLFYGILATGGPALVIFCNMAATVLAFYLLWKLWRYVPRSLLAAMALLLAVLASLPRLQPRQETISALFLALLVLFLLDWQSGKYDAAFERRAPKMWMICILLPAFFCLWANLHALSVMGLIILFCAAGGDGLQTRMASNVESTTVEMARRRANRLVVLAILAMMAMCFNPYGLSYLQAAAPLRPGNMAKSVVEWRPVWQAPQSPFAFTLAEGLLFFWALWAWMRNTDRRWSHGLWLLFGLAVTLKSRRMLWLAAILFFAVLAVHISALSTLAAWRAWRGLMRDNSGAPVPDGMRVLLHAGFSVCVATLVFLTASQRAPQNAAAGNRFVRDVPEGAARFLEKQPASLRLFNDYEDSSYLQWRLNGRPRGDEAVPSAGRHPLYLDLLNAYPDGLAYEYLDILKANARGLEKLRARRVEAVVLGEHQWSQPLARYLEDNKNRQWRRVFGDAQSRIWMRADRLTVRVNP